MRKCNYKKRNKEKYVIYGSLFIDLCAFLIYTKFAN